MQIDEDERWKLKKYGKKVTKTDHNTILVKIGINGRYSVEKEPATRYNIRNVEARMMMKENIESNGLIDEIFKDSDRCVDDELMVFI